MLPRDATVDGVGTWEESHHPYPVRNMREYMQEGYTWVVDLDIEKFFDRVNHDIVMARVARKVKDKWKRVHTRYRELRRLGQPEWKVQKVANARKGPWRMANGPLNSILTLAYWQSQGLINLVVRYQEIRKQWGIAGCETACPVMCWHDKAASLVILQCRAGSCGV